MDKTLCTHIFNIWLGYDYKRIFFTPTFYMKAITIMSSNATTAARTIGVRPKPSEKKVVIKELQKKLKGRPAQERKPSDSTQFSQKSLTNKQVINENMLAARARWLAQNKDKDEDTAMISGVTESGGGDSGSGGDGGDKDDSGGRGSGSGESDADEKRERQLAMSYEHPRRHRVSDTDSQKHASRAYSISSIKGSTTQPPQKITPPRSNPGGVPTSRRTTKTVSPVASGAKIYRETKQNRDEVKKQSSGSSTGSAVKKLFGFKPKKKRKGTKKMTRIAPTRVDGESSEIKKRNGGAGRSIEKSMSDSGLVTNQVLAFTSRVEDELNSLPINQPYHGYQNVFENPEFAKYTQQHKRESRSNTGSPSDNIALQQNKKPKPLPRPQVPGSTMARLQNCSTGSDQESELETPPPLDSLTHDISSGTGITKVPYIHNSTTSLELEMSDDSSTRSGSCNIVDHRQKLGKTASFNPDSSGWSLMRRGSSQKQKDLRRGICSDGDQTDLEDDYITMNSISLLKNVITPTENQISNFSSNSFSLEQGPNTSPDPNRQSAYYLKILPDNYGLSSSPGKVLPKFGTQLEETEDSVKQEGSNNKIKQLHKGYTVPSININSRRDLNTPSVTDRPKPQEGPAEDKRSTRSTTPMKPSPTASANSDNQEHLKPSKRKLQYTSVMLEAGDQMKFHGPKKCSYQTVTLANENEKVNISEGEELSELATTPTGGQVGERGHPDIDSRDKLHPEVKQHPLLNLSLGGRRSPLNSVGAERSYYVNRNSLIDSLDFPTTMFSTVDPVTGKVVWHEYVEMDEENIDRLATSIGMIKSAPIIPDKLEALLKFNHQGEAPNQDEVEGTCRDTDVLCDNTISPSDCSYISNLNEPPAVPYRPENLDEIVDQLKSRSSDDYSYAFIPSMGARWMMNSGKPTPTSPTKSQTCVANNTNTINIIEAVVDNKGKHDAVTAPRVKSPITASKSLQPSNISQQKRPPSLPPRTESLLREQELVKFDKKSSTQGLLLPIIVRTKDKGKKSFAPSKSSSSILHSSENQRSLEPGSGKEDIQSNHYQIKKKNNPPKPIPYVKHRQQLQKKDSVPKSSNEFLSITSPSQSKNETPTLSTDPLIRQEVAKFVETEKSEMRSNAHKKLARQRPNEEEISLCNSASPPKKEAENLSAKQPKNSDMHLQKTNSSRDIGFNFSEKESLAILMQNKDRITKKLIASQVESKQKEGKESVAQSNETEASQKTRGLSNILVELGDLLKCSDFSEEDVLSAIEHHLKMTIQKKRSDSTLIGGTCERNSNEREELVGEESIDEGVFKNDFDEEGWISGEEPESDIEVGQIDEPKNYTHTLPTNSQVSHEEHHEFEPDDDKEKFVRKSNALYSETCDDEESKHSYINYKFSTGVKFDKNESQRHSYVNFEMETNLDRALRSPRTPERSLEDNEGQMVNTPATTKNRTSSTSSSTSSSSLVELRERSQTAVTYASQKQNMQRQDPRSNRAQSNPNVELADAVVAAESASNYQSTHNLRKLRGRTTVETNTSAERTFSYCLALQMEDRHISEEAGINTNSRIGFAREEGKF